MKQGKYLFSKIKMMSRKKRGGYKNSPVFLEGFVHKNLYQHFALDCMCSDHHGDSLTSCMLGYISVKTTERKEGEAGKYLLSVF